MSQNFGVDESLLNAVIEGTVAGLQMAEIKPDPVGFSRMASASGQFDVLIGLVGKQSGTVSLSFSEEGLLHIVSGMLGEPQTELDEVALDCIMEVVNIVAGQVKTSLTDTPYQVDQISLPSLVLGGQYVYYSKGLDVCSVTFELPGMPITTFSERIFTTTISLLRSAGK